jgi:nucleotide-binding universal stress UspA family protein
MLKTILVAADGSDHADKAVDWAIELAAKHDTRLLLIYVAPHREVPPDLRRLAEVEHIVEPGGVERRSADPAYPAGPVARPDLGEAAAQSAMIDRRSESGFWAPRGGGPKPAGSRRSRPWWSMATPRTRSSMPPSAITPT